MMKFFSGLFFFLIIQTAFAQDAKTTAFISLFQEIEFTAKHVYSFARHPSDFPSTSTYPFKGIPIDSSFHSLFMDIDSEELDRSEYYATYKFFINYNIEALLIRESQMEGTEHHIYYLIFDHEKNEITSSLELSYEYAYEGNFGGMESWILNINGDGQKDIISRMWSESNFITDDGGLETVHHDSVVLSIFDGRKFEIVGIDDTLYQKQIERDFSYYEETRLSYDTKQETFNYLKKKIDIEIPKRNEGYWYIIAGSDKDLPSAKHEIKRAYKIIGFNYKYGLDARSFDIYENNKRYYTAIKFRTKAEAEIALREIKKTFNATAYIVEKKEWCPESEYQKGRYLRCKD